MKFRIFEYQPDTGTYVIARCGPTPDVIIGPHKSKEDLFFVAAVKWANDYYRGPSNKIHVLVARMCPSVEEVKPITLTCTTPWQAQHTMINPIQNKNPNTYVEDNGEPDDDDNF